MALTTTYSITPLLVRIFPAADPASNSDTVALTGGGFATVADVPGGIRSQSSTTPLATSSPRLSPHLPLRPN